MSPEPQAVEALIASPTAPGRSASALSYEPSQLGSPMSPDDELRSPVVEEEAARPSRRVFCPMNPPTQGGSKTPIDGTGLNPINIDNPRKFIQSRTHLIWPGKFAACLSQAAAITAKLELDRLSEEKFDPEADLETRDQLAAFLESYAETDETILTAPTLQILSTLTRELEREMGDFQYMSLDVTLSKKLYYTMSRISTLFQQRCRSYLREITELTSEIASELQSPDPSTLMARAQYLPLLEEFRENMGERADRFLKRNASYFMSLLQIELAQFTKIGQDTSSAQCLIQLISPYMPAPASAPRQGPRTGIQA